MVTYSVKLNQWLEKTRQANNNLVPKKVQVVPDKGKIYWATRWVKPHTEEEKLFSPDEKRALANYKGYGALHINNHLRFGKSDNAKIVQFILNEIRLLDLAFDKSPALQEDLIVYRGFRKRTFAYPETGSNFFLDHGFVSTTRDIDIARRFGDGVIKILIPKGSKVIDLEFTMPTKEQKEREKEILLPRDSRFQIIGNNFMKLVINK